LRGQHRCVEGKCELPSYLLRALFGRVAAAERFAIDPPPTPYVVDLAGSRVEDVADFLVHGEP
jgi:hypothetical protein